MFELAELLAYFAAFWLFIFSPRFRRTRLDTVRAASWTGRLVLTLEAVVAAICGLLPAAVLALLR